MYDEIHNIICNKCSRLMNLLLVLLDTVESLHLPISLTLIATSARSVRDRESTIGCGEKFDIVDSFCYVGDILGTEGRADAALRQ